ncbi:hypothetical protein LTR17_019955 [Elasticomyces elasticus]|nr:hypothetical protein LTR17_019955 [Elasticomyces elasticus]
MFAASWRLGMQNQKHLDAHIELTVLTSAFVTFCDVNKEQGQKLEADLPSESVCFVQAVTGSWDDQLRMFKAAKSRSPRKSVDVVIANAGVGCGSGDPMMALGDPNATPTKPSMHIIDINLTGVIYTLELAIHFFRGSPVAAERDCCFIFGSSIAGYADNLSSWEYLTSKLALELLGVPPGGSANIRA